MPGVTMRRRTLAVAVAVAALGPTPFASEAFAHSLSPASPASGDSGTTYKFTGRAWQPRGVVTAQYYRFADARRPFRQFTFRASGSGWINFRFSNPWFFETGNTQKLCFVQFDTRRGRSYRKCARFYVAPPTAYFMPADGDAGRLFILVVNGFEPGRSLTIQLTRPDGVVEVYGITTRWRGAFITGGEWGPLYIRKGGGFRRFQSNPTDPLGLYTALVFDPESPARARAALLVQPG
jgi:hypothetical protein